MTSSPTARYSRITGTGSYLPPKRLSNSQLAEQLAADGVEKIAVLKLNILKYIN